MLKESYLLLHLFSKTLIVHLVRGETYISNGKCLLGNMSGQDVSGDEAEITNWGQLDFTGLIPFGHKFIQKAQRGNFILGAGTLKHLHSAQISREP